MSASIFTGIAAAVNGAGALWHAAPPTRFANLDQVKQLCGSRETPLPDYLQNQTHRSAALENDDVPATFDAREAWPGCSVIGRVHDQANCGSCWAFSAIAAFEGDLCVYSGDDVTYSAEDTVSCCTGSACGYSDGCTAGTPNAALSWMTVMGVGVVTGGDYAGANGSAAEGCLDYALAPCTHIVGDETDEYPADCSHDYPVVTCAAECSNADYPLKYADDKTTGPGGFPMGVGGGLGVAGIQAALQAFGPLTTSFTVYEDFTTYESGIYHYVTGAALGMHAVTLIGWGAENGTDYWTVKNSWNPTWGEGGFFRIRRGTNEVGIEWTVYGVQFNG